MVVELKDLQPTLRKHAGSQILIIKPTVPWPIELYYHYGLLLEKQNLAKPRDQVVTVSRGSKVYLLIALRSRKTM